MPDRWIENRYNYNPKLEDIMLDGMRAQEVPEAATHYEAFADKYLDPNTEAQRMFRMYPIWPLEGIPEEWINREHPGYQESIFQAPLLTIDPTFMGEIKGRPANVRRMLRDIMKDQLSVQSVDELTEVFKTGKVSDFFRNLLKGVWFHGRRTPPDPKSLATFGKLRRRGTLFGEPVGTSLTKSLSKASDFSGGETGALLRARPVFEGDPLSQVIFHQYEPHARIMNEAYVQTMRELYESGRYPDLIHVKELQGLKNVIGKTTFNAKLTEILERQGYRGILYSPVERYREYELKMFPGHRDPNLGSDFVYWLDKRKFADPEMQRWFGMVGRKQERQWEAIAEQQPYHHLKEHYRGINLRKTVKEITGVDPNPQLTYTGKQVQNMKVAEEAKGGMYKYPSIHMQSGLSPEEVKSVADIHMNKIEDYIDADIGLHEATQHFNALEEMSGWKTSKIYDVIKNLDMTGKGELYQAINDTYYLNQAKTQKYGFDLIEDPKGKALAALDYFDDWLKDVHQDTLKANLAADVVAKESGLTYPEIQSYLQENDKITIQKYIQKPKTVTDHIHDFIEAPSLQEDKITDNFSVVVEYAKSSQLITTEAEKAFKELEEASGLNHQQLYALALDWNYATKPSELAEIWEKLDKAVMDKALAEANEVTKEIRKLEDLSPESLKKLHETISKVLKKE